MENHAPALISCIALWAPAAAQDRVDGHLVYLQDNGAWSWFEDERGIVDRWRGRLLVGSCADDSGLGGAARGGDIDVAWLDFATGTLGSFELRDRLQGDDHNSPALLLRPDGRYLAMFGTHGGPAPASRLSRWRVGSQPGVPDSWTPERSYQHPAGMSYSNLFHLRATARSYNFVRADNFDPTVMVSRDLGSTWTGGGKLLTEGTGRDRPYLKYASDGESRIHLLTTERHPRDFDNSIYHGYVEGDALYDSAGAKIDPNILDGQGQPPARLTRVFGTGTVVGGVAMRRGWTLDLAVDPAGVVRALFQMRAADQQADHRLFFARFDGTRWTSHQVCRLGAPLYAAEGDYTGLAALHPDRPDTLFVSTTVDPRTNTGTAKHEIYAARTGDLGRTWTFTPVTEGSTVDNLRPIVPQWDADRTALLWLRGDYRAYTDYDLAVVGRIEAPELTFGRLTYHDATTANTTLPSGAGAGATGPAAGQGAADGRWHLRTGFGNGAYVWTSDELGDEDVPALRTRLTGLAAGTYEVFVAFWSNPGERWRLRAGLSPGSLRNLQKRGAAAAEAAQYTTPPVLAGPTVRLYHSWIGRGSVTGNGTLDVFVDDYAAGQSGSSRSWYDGIAIAPLNCPASTQSVGRGCGGPPDLVLSAPPQLGASLDLRIANARPGALGLLQLGSGDLLPVSLAPAGFPACTLWTDGILDVPLGSIDAAGASTPLRFRVPLDPALRCARVGLQGGALSGSLQLTPAMLVLPGS